MNMVFVYEDKIAKDREGHFYTGSAFSQSVFDRYLQFFEHITLLMRDANVDPDDEQQFRNRNRIDEDKIDVILIPDVTKDLRSFLSIRKRRELKNCVFRSVSNAEAVVIRAPSRTGYIASKYCRKTGKSYLAEAVGCPWDSLRRHSRKGKVLAPFAWHQMRFIMRNASHAVYVTREFLQNRYPTNGIATAVSDVELTDQSGGILEERVRKINDHEGPIVIGTAGALHVPYKGQRYVIEALAMLRERGRSDFEYHLLGGGDHTDLSVLAERLGVLDQVVFDGALSHDEVFRWYDQLDVYIQPSTVEAMPRALIEAMSRGLPALGSDVGGIPELLGRDFLFSPGKPEEIVQRLAELNNNILKENALKNYEKSKDFTCENLSNRRNAIYRSYSEKIREKYEEERKTGNIPRL